MEDDDVLGNVVMNECHFADEALREAFRQGAVAALRVVRERVLNDEAS